MLLNFGSGELFCTAIVDANGNALSSATPIRVAGMQEFSCEFSGDVKEFHGQSMYAIAAARGKVKASGKIKGALINANAFNTMFFNGTLTSGTAKASVDGFSATIPTTPFQVTITPPSSGTFTDDLGVIDAAGVPMTKVASAPVTGQYSVNGTGVYTFAAADTGKLVYISYGYTFSDAGSRKIVLDNNAMGQMPVIKALYKTQFRGKQTVFEMESIVFTKLGVFANKNDDFSVQEADFMLQANAAGTVIGTIYTRE